jgi:heptosyltransferase-2
LKILVISFAGIGDTLFATPLIHELRANFPEATLDVFVRWSGSKGLLANNPHVDTVHQKDIAADSKIGSLAFLTKLRSKRYDVSINTFPQSRRDYRIVAKAINAKLRLSHEYDNFTAFDRRLTNKSIPVDYSRHAVENNLSLLQFLDVKPKLPRHRYELFLKDTEREWAADYIEEHRLKSRPLLGIHVGSGGTKNLAQRRWPLKNYIELVQQLHEKEPELAVLFFGGPEEKQDHARLQATSGLGKLFFPKTENMRQAGALLSQCDLFLSVDTSLMHIAATVGVKKQIVIETPTWNKPIEPYGNFFILVKNPAVAGRNLEYYRYDGGNIKGTPEELQRCMVSVKVEDVLETVTKLL